MAITNQESPRAPIIADLYQRHAAWLRCVVRRRSGVEGAEDVVQEAFERLIALGDLPLLDSPRAFLSKVAQNLLRDNARKGAAAKRTAPQNIFLDPPLAGSTEQFETVLLKQVILALPAPQREVFLLSRFGGLSYAEIARVCGVSVKTVEWRMAKAVAHCAATLRE